MRIRRSRVGPPRDRHKPWRREVGQKDSGKRVDGLVPDWPCFEFQVTMTTDCALVCGTVAGCSLSWSPEVSSRHVFASLAGNQLRDGNDE